MNHEEQLGVVRRALELENLVARAEGTLKNVRRNKPKPPSRPARQVIEKQYPELTPKERTYEWHKLEERYMPWRQYGDNEFMKRGGYWYHKLHIYLYPFYYINYTLTTMGAMEFKKKYAENREAAWSDYLKLCKVGGSMSYLETLKHANLSVPFEAGAVAKATSYAAVILLQELEKMQ